MSAGAEGGLIRVTMAVAAATAGDLAVAGGPVRPATPSAADADRRATRLEALLGDPYAPDNPHGLTALFEADARGRPPEQTELLLEQFGLSAECVPVADGGRLTRADLLARVLRPVFRRDVTLGTAVGTAPVLAAGPVWAAGTTHRRAQTAALLLGGGRVGLVPHGRGQTAATTPGGITARPAPDGGLLLGGRAEAAPDAIGARLYVVQARTGPARSPHSHTAVLLDGGRLPPLAVRETGRAAAPGRLRPPRAEIELHEHAVPHDAVLGPVGEGVPLALRAQQVGHALVPALLVAAADTALRSAVRAAGGGASPGRPHRRLAGVFADILACDSFAGAALRALSLLPAQAQVPAAAVHYLVPALLRENLEALACVLGARRHDRGSAHHGALGRLMRTLPLAASGPARTGAADGQAVIAPHLRPLAEHSWFAEPEPPLTLFRGSDLPVLDFASLAAAGHGDFLAASLCGSAARFAEVRGVGGHTAVLAELVQSLVTELHALRARCRALPGPGDGPLPVAAVCALVDRYALVLAAAAVLGMWESQDGADPFLAAPAWPVLALSRIARRLGAPVPPLPDGVEELVHRELVRRCHEHLSYDLDATELAP
ncbi:acyl-CoA dehydrogenase [Streptomyces europaeiscabiei]|uniref:Acyl-CoA dehydrogenase n=3 Tax=Streptomyces europaeiscabiei TaxID=146819 RepID=A0ABU4NXH3_9ACTN|nr:acyl-CoA dehydrogenase [Streptomyces europaeiscabiei]MDX2531351.1 acyl-CoA dehydrogenase [Streptomyces europaeiscabiei]MDX2759416.1 acyl-CoA dehydrogenase [Streptomyces europaeiscabiei]MDX3549836.1 acyl-CoA dehydrogenase [Streptomyces europaeiscabiei]MDX3673310.1 acyl-CoA dehydrogenase [Streptomyces europaeiscabiei]MDX3706753.1 acyl-CoA dehydrogenase [Streptomyces europaeiscabiei]